MSQYPWEDGGDTRPMYEQIAEQEERRRQKRKGMGGGRSRF